MPRATVGVLPIGLLPRSPTHSSQLVGDRGVAVETKPSRLTSSSVEFSRSVFAIWWIAIGLVHGIALGYHGRITKFYWRLPNSPIGEMVELYDLVLPSNYSRSVAVVNAAIAAVHSVALLRMLRNSIRARQLVFYVEKPRNRQELRSQSTLLPKRTRIRRLAHKLNALFAYKGALGVEGKYFDLVLYVAEFVETLLQTYQAFRVNSLVARRWISRLYVGVLVFNCWCIPLIHVMYKTRIAHKRLLCLMCDCVLDLVSSIVLPGVLFFVYLADYDAEIRNMERTRWYDDRWLVQLWSEHDLVMIASWPDALSRLVFALGLLLSMENVKQLLRAFESVETTSQPQQVLIRRLTCQLQQAMTPGPEPDTKHWIAGPQSRRLVRLVRIGTKNLVLHLQRVRWSAIFHASLVLWGVVAVAIHTNTEIQEATAPRLAVCPLQFAKWLRHAPVCLLVDINCNALDIDGRADEIERHWQQLDPSRVLRLVIRHCPALEMPPSLGIFRNLKSIKLYNTTLVSWNVSDSFTDATMSRFRSLQLIRVHFSDARLPDGLHASTFPTGVRTIEMCATNLHELPSDLDQSWPRALRLSLESSKFTAMPPVALRLLPWQLSLSGNPIVEVPAALFQSPGVHRIGLAHTMIRELPNNVSAVPATLRQVTIAHSHVHSSLPAWMDAVVERAQGIPYRVVAYFAGGTPHCADQASIGHEHTCCISCDASEDEISYPLAFEDQQSEMGILA